MITESDQNYLSERRDTLAEVKAIRVEMAVKVRELVTAGEPVAELVKLTGLTRARIYQIRDKRR